MKGIPIMVAAVSLSFGCAQPLTKKANDSGTTTCPQCGRRFTEIPYLVSGVPAKDMAEKMECGEVLLAGCVGTNELATVCLTCRQWKTHGMQFWQPLPKQFGSKPEAAKQDQ